MGESGNSGLDHETITRPAWQEPMPEQEILRRLSELNARNIVYGRDPILGFPGTPPLAISQRVYCEHLSAHANNIGRHTNPEGSERGFEGSQQAERDVIAMCADLMDANAGDVDGYISPGGTEANVVGCWIGRNRNRSQTAIVGSFLSHYSIVKAADLLDIGTKPRRGGSGFHAIGTDSNGHILLDQLECKLKELALVGVRNVIVIGNAGTTMLGSVDDIPSICAVIETHEGKFASVHLHVDAAFGGFVIPFLDLPRIGFSNPRVDSLTIDLHKMGLAPYGSGVILARTGLFERVRTHAPYVRGNDTTLCGSRGGVNAYSCWAVMKSLGKSGYARIVRDCMKLTALIQERFAEDSLLTFQNDINIVAVRGGYPEALIDQYITHIQADFPADMSNPAGTKKQTVWNVVVMPHMTIEIIEAFIAARNG